MSKPLRFHSEALKELTAEALYDEAKSIGLGARFKCLTSAKADPAGMPADVGTQPTQGSDK